MSIRNHINWQLTPIVPSAGGAGQRAGHRVPDGGDQAGLGGDAGASAPASLLTALLLLLLLLLLCLVQEEDLLCELPGAGPGGCCG